VKFQAYRPPPEQFLSSIDYVDQLDVDGDGIGEVFTIQGGFDAYAYVIFKKCWRAVARSLTRHRRRVLMRVSSIRDSGRYFCVFVDGAS